jgi:adenine-specific DNA-methyltransferase
MLTETLDLFDVPANSKNKQIELPDFPTTRYQGSKRKIIKPMAAAFGEITFDTALDLFSGSATVSLLLRHLGKKIDANDYMLFNRNVAQLFLTATPSDLSSLNPMTELRELLHQRDVTHKSTVADRYDGIFFTQEENRQIDNFCQNIAHIDSFRQLLYVYAVGQSLMKKRPYNLFHRANLGMRTKDVKRSFGNAITWEKSIEEHALKAVNELLSFPFRNELRMSAAHSVHASDLTHLPDVYDLVYVDPPYLNSKGLETNYSNFYGFLNGLCSYELFASGNDDYPHKPMLIHDSGWRTELDALKQVEAIARRWPSSVIFFSYRSDGLPSGESLCEALSVGGRRAKLHSFGEFKYALSRTNTNEELYIVSLP